MIEIRDMCKNYGSFGALNRVSLDVGTGEVVSVIGPSGSGKSTLLRCLNLMEKADAGQIRFGGRNLYEDTPSGVRLALTARDLYRVRSRVGHVFQGYHLFQHLTALENVMEGPLAVLKLTRPAARDRAREMLDLVGLRDKEDSFPAQLSGGQQQRVAIARALAMGPDALLLDEPTSALDPQLAGEVLAVVERLASQGMTMLIVTHDMRLARGVSRRVAFMEKGRITVSGDPHRLLRGPDDPRIAQFLGRSASGEPLRYPPPVVGWGH